jgi:hypothetical protein
VLNLPSLKDLLTKEEIGTVLKVNTFLTGPCEFPFVLLVKVRVGWRVWGSVAGSRNYSLVCCTFGDVSAVHAVRELVLTVHYVTRKIELLKAEFRRFLPFDDKRPLLFCSAVLNACIMT